MISKSIKTVSGMFVIMIFAKILGQVREMMLAGYYGTSTAASAFLTASQIPLNFFDMILGLAIVSAFVPVFNEYYQKNGKDEANAFANNFIGVVSILSVVISLIGMIFSQFLVKILANGFDSGTAALTSQLLKIMFPSLAFTALAYSYAGILQSYGEFKIPAAMSIASNFVAIIYFLLFNKRFGIYGLAVAMLIGWGLQLIILLPSVFKFGYKFSPKFNFLHPGMKKIYKLAFPILLSSWVQPVNVMINLYLASFIDGGNAVSYINYANKLYLIIVGVFTMSVTNLILPELSRLFADDNKKESAHVIGASIKAGIIFVTPIMLLFLTFSYQIVEVIYMRGAFDAESTKMTSVALFFYSFGMLGYGLQEILNKSFYSMQNSIIPMKNAIFSICINIILSFLLYKKMGVAGLALASAIAAVCSAVNLLHKIKKSVQLVDLNSTVALLVKTVVAAVISCIISKLVYALLGQFAHGLLLKFAILAFCVLCTLLIYITLLIVMRVKDVRNLLRKGE